MSENINYEEALEELKEILIEVQNPDIELHILEAKMKRAKVLMEQCKHKLKTIEESIN